MLKKVCYILLAYKYFLGPFLLQIPGVSPSNEAIGGILYIQDPPVLKVYTPLHTKHNLILLPLKFGQIKQFLGSRKTLPLPLSRTHTDKGMAND